MSNCWLRNERIAHQAYNLLFAYDSVFFHFWSTCLRTLEYYLLLVYISHGPKLWNTDVTEEVVGSSEIERILQFSRTKMSYKRFRKAEGDVRRCAVDIQKRRRRLPQVVPSELKKPMKIAFSMSCCMPIRLFDRQFQSTREWRESVRRWEGTDATHFALDKCWNDTFVVPLAHQRWSFCYMLC